MKRSLKLLFLLTIFSFKANAQSCLHTDLSKKFDYKVTNTIISKSSDNIPAFRVTVIITDKKTRKMVQKISFNAGFLFEEAYQKCNTVRSYITGRNQNKEVLDYDFGDLIVADLNFDGKEDLAVKYDSGGNGGPMYNFYMQDENGQFKIDNFLTDSVGSFPRFISFKSKTITTQIHANVYQEGKKSFRYDSASKKWKLVRWVMVNAGS